SPNQVAQTGEYDDMYFTASDRQAVAYNSTQAAPSNTDAEQFYDDKDSYSAKTANPEYIAQNQSENAQGEEDVAYYEEDYNQSSEGRYSDVRNYNYYGRGFSNYNAFYDPFYAPYRDPFYSPYYDPYFRPGFRSGFSMSFGFGYGYGAFHDPFYGPGMGYGMGYGYGDPWGYRNSYYNGFYNGFYNGYNRGRYGNPYYYSPVIIVEGANTAD